MLHKEGPVALLMFVLLKKDFHIIRCYDIATFFQPCVQFVLYHSIVICHVHSFGESTNFIVTHFLVKEILLNGFQFKCMSVMLFLVQLPLCLSKFHLGHIPETSFV